MREDLLQIRSFGVSFYALRDAQGIYLIDGGFIGGIRAIKNALRTRNWDSDPILGIIVTHGHLDHILNISRIADEAGAWIAAPRLDAPHYEGRPSYRGVARFTGLLEAVGRTALGFRHFTPSRFLDDGDSLDIWHGLSVIHLPGHTEGHSGLYCERLKLLFCGDLFASYDRLTHFPPHILNIDSNQVLLSASRATDLDLNGVLPSHCDSANSEVHFQRLKTLLLNLKLKA